MHIAAVGRAGIKPTALNYQMNIINTAVAIADAAFETAVFYFCAIPKGEKKEEKGGGLARLSKIAVKAMR